MTASATPVVHREHPPAPVRIVHLGLGAFHRAHQAWYTARATDAADWGIAGFTGRSRALADQLQAQDCVYTLIERSADGDHFQTIESIVQAHSGDDVVAFVELLKRPEVAVVTLTVTEAGYLVGPDGELRVDDPVIAADIAAMCRGAAAPTVRSVVARLLMGLRARYDAGLPALAVVSCDNLPDNGRLLARACRTLAEAVLPGAPLWIDDVAAFVCTSVDRITPRAAPGDEAVVRSATGYVDQAPVVTEPFSDWVLEGEFPAGRPDWESVGARFVADIRPWELRKLWLLNGAHTLMAALGTLLGHHTVDEAIRDPHCRDAVTLWWDEACQHLPDGLDLGQYREALLARFENPRIAHSLAQIAQDAHTKVRIRIVPVALRELAAGRRPAAALVAIAAVLVATAVTPDEESIRRALDGISADLAGNADVVTAITANAALLSRPPTDPARKMEAT